LEIPQTIIDKAPSAGLYDGQTDEKEIGMTYKELDEILKCLDNIYDKKTDKVIKLIENSEHKRNLPPICKL